MRMKVLLAQKDTVKKKLSRSSWLKHAIIPEHQCTGMMGEFAGFSNVEPWLMPTGQDKINVEAELESGAIFNFYQN